MITNYGVYTGNNISKQNSTNLGFFTLVGSLCSIDRISCLTGPGTASVDNHDNCDMEKF